jgi:hypothetical protein
LPGVLLETSAVTSHKFKPTRYTAVPAGSGITAETVVATINVASQSIATTVKLSAAISISCGSGAPAWGYYSRIRLTNTSGTVLQTFNNTKTSATGINDYGNHTHLAFYSLPATTAQTFVLTLSGSQAVAVNAASTDPIFVAELESNV